MSSLYSCILICLPGYYHYKPLLILLYFRQVCFVFIAQEIARREAALHEREQNIERLGPGESPKNFPPFPKFCPSPFKPCFYISIKNEVHPTQQWKVYLLLALMICKSTYLVILHIICPL